MTSKQSIIHISNRRISQVLFWLGLAVTMVFLWVSHSFLTDRFTAQQLGVSQQRAGLYANSISSTLQRNAYVPLLLSRNFALIRALVSEDYTYTDQRLMTFKEDYSTASITLLNTAGEIVAATDERELGTVDERPGFFVRALREEETVFQALRENGVIIGFYYARKIESKDDVIGVVVVEVDLQRHEQIWQNVGAQVILSDSEGKILLASNSRWRQTTLQNLLTTTFRPTTSERILSSTVYGDTQIYSYIDGQKLLLSDSKIGFLGWHLSYFAGVENVKARVNALMALEIMVLSIIAALVFFLISRQTTRASAELIQESAELHRLNIRLSNEIEQRLLAEKNLVTAEQSLEQASKLAALGQMSASVSHELNQPLAAMRTYLAGARLLLQRNRTDEALTSFQRIDDLIERMGAITKQLKSHARKSTGELQMVDLRDSVASALSMMAPQLGKTQVNIVRNIANEAANVKGDPVRIEQIIINLLRNALDAVQDVEDKKITITLKVGASVYLSVLDNGTGIKDTESLFEPFSTTKKPGEGVGLGLAISAGFATEMGGKLTGRNQSPIGAIFELQLPRANAQ